MESLDDDLDHVLVVGDVRYNLSEVFVALT